MGLDKGPLNGLVWEFCAPWVWDGKSRGCRFEFRVARAVGLCPQGVEYQVGVAETWGLAGSPGLGSAVSHGCGERVPGSWGCMGVQGHGGRAFCVPWL